MQVASKPLLGFLLNPFRTSPYLLTLQETGISARGGYRPWIGFEDLAQRPEKVGGWMGSSLHLTLSDGNQLRVPALRNTAAQAFTAAIIDAWTTHNRNSLREDEPFIKALLAGLESLRTPQTYPAAHLVNPLAAEADRLTRKVLGKLSTEMVGSETMRRIAPIIGFAKDPVAARAAAIECFVSRQLEDWASFFDTVESQPLTPEQRLSVVVDEDATLVLAGAGSGKTSVITAKAAYLVKAGIRSPEQLLLLAFAKDAATEMSERIEARCGVLVAARTFHSLAYEIIGAVEGSKPALASTATDEKAFLTLIQQILRHIVETVQEIASSVIAWFAGFFEHFPVPWDFHTAHDWYEQIEKHTLRTLQGETVASFEELLIANWLYCNGIAYEHEPNYQHQIHGTGRRDYTPDFRLTESGVYLEHFGVRKKRMPDGSEQLVTAPFVDRESYLEGIRWKREVHAEHGTTLIETYSWEREDGTLLEALEAKLAPHVTKRPIPALEIYDRVTKVGEVDGFTRLVATFLRHFKNGGYEVEDCEHKAKRLKHGRRADAFLSIFGAVFHEYQKRLGDRIDFEDMVNRATRYAEEGRYHSPFRHILVDEFQDISTGRARLIRALKAQHGDARVFAVGDDWQSIYRFAGSDIHIMRDFGREFGGTYAGENGIHRTIDLGRTFRSVDKIALAARRFVLQNPAQLTKTVVPAGEAEEPAIRVAWTRRETGQTVLEQTIASLAAEQPMHDRTPTILLLGRYRFLEPDMRHLRLLHPAVKLSFKTIHASKGLEADHVVILGADNTRLGLPSGITDDPLLSLVSPEEEHFEHAEERRVMYVAMTRARKTVTLLASEARPSSFVTELLRNPEYEVIGPEEQAARTHECLQCGGRLLHMPGKNETGWYRCEHVTLCGNRMSACPSCGVGLPRLKAETGQMQCTRCEATQPECPDCKDGWLVERRGKFGSFLGCVRFPACSGKAKLKRDRRPRSAMMRG